MTIISSADNDLQLSVNNFFSQYSNWCTLKCIDTNPVKSKFVLLFNSANVSVRVY